MLVKANFKRTVFGLKRQKKKKHPDNLHFCQLFLLFYSSWTMCTVQCTADVLASSVKSIRKVHLKFLRQFSAEKGLSTVNCCFYISSSILIRFHICTRFIRPINLNLFNYNNKNIIVFLSVSTFRIADVK